MSVFVGPILVFLYNSGGFPFAFILNSSKDEAAIKCYMVIWIHFNLSEFET